jgi:hypothetical protein
LNINAFQSLKVVLKSLKAICCIICQSKFKCDSILRIFIGKFTLKSFKNLELSTTTFISQSSSISSSIHFLPAGTSIF